MIKHCPSCCRPVPAETRKCPYCPAVFPETPKDPPSPPAALKTFSSPVVWGVLALGLAAIWLDRRGAPQGSGSQPGRDPYRDIQNALAAAKRTKKRVLLDVGGDWCGWCRRMDQFFAANPDLAELRDKNFVLVKVDVEPGGSDVGALSHYPPIRGYPHLFVLDENEKVLESKETSQLVSGGNYDHEKFRAFLDSWISAAAPPAHDVGIQWVSLPGGSFTMGTDDVSAADIDKPAHSVTVPAFQIAKTAVTAGQYGKCVDAGACSKPGCETKGEDYPIVCVDWDQAKTFARWAGGRLPTEAEREFACGSAKGQTYPWGGQAATCERAVMGENEGPGCGRDSAWPVCSKPLGNTDQGLCDMAGNVWEWTQDNFVGTYRGAPADGSAWESPLSTQRMIRGGAFSLGAGELRCSSHAPQVPAQSVDYIGFRLARSP